MTEYRASNEVNESIELKDAAAKHEPEKDPSRYHTISVHSQSSNSGPDEYRLYKRRFSGLLGMVSLESPSLNGAHLGRLGHPQYCYRYAVAMVRAHIE